MASTIYSYALEAGRNVFPVSFEYLARRFVTVTLVGTTRLPLTLNVDFRFISKMEIETTVNWPPGEYQTMEIRRVTSSTDRLVNFTDGSILRSQDLNISQIQAIHIAEEGRDVAENSLLTDGFTWDSLGRRVRNVGYPVVPTDAVNVQYVLDSLNSTLRVARSESLNEVPTDRANKVLAFDSNRQPVAIIPSAGSSMELELALASTEANKGASKIGIIDTKGLPSTVLKEIQKMNQEYKVPAWSQLFGNLQVGPLIVNMSRKLDLEGNLSKLDANDAEMLSALAGLPFGAEMEFPARGLTYLKGGYNVDAGGANFRGKNSGASYDQFAMRFIDATKPAFLARHSGISMSNLFLQGAVPGRGLNATQDAIEFNVVLNAGHADARFSNVAFLNFRAGASVIKSAARNIRFMECTFSNSRNALLLTYVPTGPEDIRVFEFADCKYHSMGRLLDANDAVFFINPESQALSLIAQGGHADDTTRIFKGFAGMSTLSGLKSTRSKGQFADIDSTGFTLAGYAQMYLDACNLMNVSTTLHQMSAIKTVGNCLVNIDGFTSAGSGGHGLEIRSSYANIKGTSIHNASMGLTETYSGYYIGAEASNVVISGSTYQQNREIAGANRLPKYAVENFGKGTVFQDQLFVDNIAGNKAYYIAPTVTSRGMDPTVHGAMFRTAYGSAIPTTGTWALGDRMINIGSALVGNGWRCIGNSSKTDPQGKWIPI